MTSRSPAGDLITALTEEVFAVNGRLLRAGDAVASSSDLTSARWQVLGVVAHRPATVAEIARQRGLRRQSVQSTVNRLRADGHVSASPNPDDRRAPLIRLEPAGREVLVRLAPLQAEWANGLATAAPPEDIETALRVLRRLRAHLDTAEEK